MVSEIFEKQVTNDIAFWNDKLEISYNAYSSAVNLDRGAPKRVGSYLKEEEKDDLDPIDDYQPADLKLPPSMMLLSRSPTIDVNTKSAKSLRRPLIDSSPERHSMLPLESSNFEQRMLELESKVDLILEIVQEMKAMISMSE